jgi:hypothetical protein
VRWLCRQAALAVKLHVSGPNHAVTAARTRLGLVVHIAGKEDDNAKLNQPEANEEEIQPGVASIVMLFPGHSGLLGNYPLGHFSRCTHLRITRVGPNAKFILHAKRLTNMCSTAAIFALLCVPLAIEPARTLAKHRQFNEN